ncbi:MAG: helix-turn-helix domain-containing protein, partial [Hyphomonadaceae bacterium]|nr:helix-turn-helix domain-containing protein [Hyphomonadaceae bacterium]
RLQRRMVEKSVRRKPVTAADLKSAQARIKKRKTKSLTRAAQQRFLARAKRRGLTKRAAADAAKALPAAPTKLQQLDAMVRAGLVDDPLSVADKSLSSSSLSSASMSDPLPDPPPFRGRGNDKQLDAMVRAGVVDDPLLAASACTASHDFVPCVVDPHPNPPPFRGREFSLTERVRALYEAGVVPVREIARLCGVSEPTLYKYAARGRWRKRYARRSLAKGAGGRFVAAAQAANEPAGLKALDPLAAAAAQAACAEAAEVASRAAGATLRRHEAGAARAALLRAFETRVRRLTLLARAMQLAGVAPPPPPR